MKTVVVEVKCAECGLILDSYHYYSPCPKCGSYGRGIYDSSKQSIIEDNKNE